MPFLKKYRPLLLATTIALCSHALVTNADCSQDNQNALKQKFDTLEPLMTNSLNNTKPSYLGFTVTNCSYSLRKVYVYGVYLYSLAGFCSATTPDGHKIRIAESGDGYGCIGTLSTARCIDLGIYLNTCITGAKNNNYTIHLSDNGFIIRKRH